MKLAQIQQSQFAKQCKLEVGPIYEGKSAFQLSILSSNIPNITKFGSPFSNTIKKAVSRSQTLIQQNKISCFQPFHCEIMLILCCLILQTAIVNLTGRYQQINSAIRLRRTKSKVPLFVSAIAHCTFGLSLLSRIEGFAKLKTMVWYNMKHLKLCKNYNQCSRKFCVFLKNDENQQQKIESNFQHLKMKYFWSLKYIGNATISTRSPSNFSHSHDKLVRYC